MCNILSIIYNTHKEGVRGKANIVKNDHIKPLNAYFHITTNRRRYIINGINKKKKRT